MSPGTQTPDGVAPHPGLAGWAWKAIFHDGSEQTSGAGRPAFTLHIASPQALQRLLASDAYTAAVSFLRGEFEVTGDLAAAIRLQSIQLQPRFNRLLSALHARIALLLDATRHSRALTRQQISFHYDRSNDFYRLFLDPGMVYSCAYFHAPNDTLESAQSAKLDLICRKLDLQPGDRLLDIGCGWGALLDHAASRYGAIATGCTLSREQYRFAAARLASKATVLDCDYRDLSGSFDKIASIGMFEHVGRRHGLPYFRKIAELLAPEGLYLHHSIARAEGTGDDPASHFVRRQIFPGNRLTHLHQMIQAAEIAGFETLDVENLRPHYAITCRHWEQRLSARRDDALRYVDMETYRAWRLWLAGSAIAFEDGTNAVYQLLLARRGAQRRRLTRVQV